MIAEPHDPHLHFMVRRYSGYSTFHISNKMASSDQTSSRDDTLNKQEPSLHVVKQPFRAYTLHYNESQSIPSSLFSDSRYSFVSVTRSAGEVTVVVGLPTSEAAPSDLEVTGLDQPREQAGPWTVFRLKGPLDLSEY